MKTKSKFEQWQDNNFKKHGYKLWFFCFLFTSSFVVILSILSLWSFFTYPKTEIAVTLPANIWLPFVFGGLGKEFALGFATYFFWVQYRKEKLALSTQQQSSESK